MNIVYCFYFFLFGVLSSFNTCLYSTHKSHNLDGRPINFSTSLAFWLWRPNTRVRNPKLANDWESRNLMRRSWQKRRTFVTKKDLLPLIGWEDIAHKFLSQSSRLVGVRQIYQISCQNLVGKYIYIKLIGSVLRSENFLSAFPVNLLKTSISRHWIHCYRFSFQSLSSKHEFSFAMHSQPFSNFLHKKVII